MKKEVILIGYSGHSYVLYDIFKSMGREVVGYCDSEYKTFNPNQLEFYGSESSEQGLSQLREKDYFIAIGNNNIRSKIQSKLYEKHLQAPINAIHNTALIGSHVQLGKGIMIAQNSILNAQATIGDGVICNTSCVVEHEVKIGDYAFIAPNTTILGGAKIGNYCFIGAGAVILQNVNIGSGSVVGAGAVVLEDVPPNSKVVGNPSRFI